MTGKNVTVGVIILLTEFALSAARYNSDERLVFQLSEYGNLIK